MSIELNMGGMYRMELYKSVKVNKPTFTLTFTQNIVDWINEQYPDRNWVRVDASFDIVPVDEVFTTGQINLLRTQTIDAPDFSVDVNIYGQLTVNDVEKIVRTFCEYIIGINPSKNIYISSLIAIGCNPSWKIRMV